MKDFSGKCDLCDYPCYLEWCDSSGSFEPGLYESPFTKDLDVQVVSVINYPNKDYIKLKIILKYKDGLICEDAAWYKIKKDGYIKYWRKK